MAKPERNVSGELLALPFVSDEPCALRVDDALGFDPFRQTTQGRGPATREPAARRSARGGEEGFKGGVVQSYRALEASSINRSQQAPRLEEGTVRGST